MLAAERRQIIKNLIRTQASVRVEDLCTRFEISASTIRRDLESLEQEGVLERTYGGAIAAELPGTQEAISLDTEHQEAKMRIGAAAADLIADGETVFVGPGTTTLAVARYLADKQEITVVTNALNVATYLTHHSSLQVILTGGQIERRETALVGHVAELTLRELRADRAILGVGGIHIPDGLTGDSLQEAQFVRLVIDMMPQVVIVADSSKWTQVGPAFLAPLEAIDVIVTDLGAPPAMVWDLTELGIKIVQT